MIRKRLADGLLALECGNAGSLRRRLLGEQIVFGCVRFELLELELHLIEQAPAALGAGAVLLALELGDLQLQVGNEGIGGRCLGLRIGKLRLGFLGALQRRGKQRLYGIEVVRNGAAPTSMSRNESASTRRCNCKMIVRARKSNLLQPALAGRQL